MGSLIFKGFSLGSQQREATQTPRLLSDVNRRKALKQIGHLFKEKTRQKGFQTAKRI